ncbi:MAG: FecR domain-containing protein, partial [Chloroflexi bacterium]|nr:FecR domain-containing protein [Chloroflexota bacterium]
MTAALLVAGFASVPTPTSANKAPVHKKAVRAKSAAVAHVRYIKRGLTVRAPKRPAHKGHKKEALYSAYFLHTGTKEKASLQFGDGSLLSINERTDAELRSPDVTFVKSGEVDQQLRPGTSHKIQTATAVAAAIGTEVDVKVVPCKKGRCAGGSKTIITVVEGAVEVSNAHGTQVVKTDQRTVVQPNSAPTPPKQADGQTATVWTHEVPPPAKPIGQNAALDSNGGGLVGYSSQLDSPDHLWDASNVIDGNLATGWQSAPGLVAGQWVKVAFAGGRTYAVPAVVLDCAATHGKDPRNQLKDFQIRVSTAG